MSTSKEQIHTLVSLADTALKTGVLHVEAGTSKAIKAIVAEVVKESPGDAVIQALKEDRNEYGDWVNILAVLKIVEGRFREIEAPRVISEPATKVG